MMRLSDHKSSFTFNKYLYVLPSLLMRDAFLSRFLELRTLNDVAKDFIVTHVKL